MKNYQDMITIPSLYLFLCADRNLRYGNSIHSKIFISTFVPNNILITDLVLCIIKTGDKGESDFNYNFAGKKAD